MDMPSRTDQISFPAELSELDPMMNWVREQATRVGFAPAEVRKIEIALEEAIVNVIHYAYSEKRGMVDLSCHLLPGEQIVFTIKDTGDPFNPLLQKQRVNPDDPLEQREEGGLGILLIREYMDEVRYERWHPHNVLTLIKKI